jgi:hypothetical protein
MNGRVPEKLDDTAVNMHHSKTVNLTKDNLCRSSQRAGISSL